MASASGRKVKTDGLFLGVLILGIAVSIILWQVCEYSGWIIPCVVLLSVGVYMIMASFMMPTTSKVGPSAASFYQVNGVMITTFGALGVIWLTTDANVWYLVGAFLIIVAALLIWKSVSSKD